jgi:hypothetical protein
VKTDKIHFIDFGGQPETLHGRPGANDHAPWLALCAGGGTAMRTEPDGRLWGARLVRAKIFGALMGFRQDGLAIGLPGAPVVDGAGQTGLRCICVGSGAAMPCAKGRPSAWCTPAALSAFRCGAGHRWQHAHPSIYPMLRISPTDGDCANLPPP